MTEQWHYDGEDTYASMDWDGYGYSVFTRDVDGEFSGLVASCIEEEDHARLIAAAPDLLEMLEHIVGVADYLGPGGKLAVDHGNFEKARAAIAKATES